MAWIESHQTLKEHPKVYKFMEQLGIPKAQAVGHLHFLWWWCVDYAPKGLLIGVNDVLIARSAEWSGEPKAFVEALVSSGFIDRRDGVLTIHDWMDFCGTLMKKRLERTEAKRKKLAPVRKKMDAYPTLPNPTQPYPTLPTTLAAKSGGGLGDPFHEFSNWVLREYTSLKPGDPDPKEKEAVSAAYRRYGRALRDILAFAKGDVGSAKKGLEAIGRRMEGLGLVWGLDAVARWFPDWAADPGGFENETKNKAGKT